MGKRWQTTRQKLRIPSWPVLLHLTIVEIILNVLWYGVSRVFGIEGIREIGFLIVFVCAIFAVSWYLPKLTPEVASFGINKKKRTATRGVSRLEHDSVLWEDGGTGFSGGIVVNGPLCPKDYTPLALKRGDSVDAKMPRDAFISDYHGTLFCLECKEEYKLSDKSKSVETSRNEVRNRFEGIRRRELI